MKKIIIIPTYNEIKNIAQTINKITGLQISDLDILVVDDNSPDNTAGVVKNLMRIHRNIYLQTRPKKLGLGSAYLAGFEFALKNNYDIIIQMDGDLSHEPAYIPAILKNMQNFDFVVCSRYVKNGGVSNWSIFRRMISRCGCLYSKFILGVKINDFTGGFNAWRAPVLNALRYNLIKSNGYSFQIELKYWAARQNFSYVEMPIIFKERTSGSSKMSKKIFLEAIWRVWWLRLKD